MITVLIDPHVEEVHVPVWSAAENPCGDAESACCTLCNKGVQYEHTAVQVAIHHLTSMK